VVESGVSDTSTSLQAAIWAAEPAWSAWKWVSTSRRRSAGSWPRRGGRGNLRRRAGDAGVDEGQAVRVLAQVGVPDWEAQEVQVREKFDDIHGVTLRRPGLGCPAGCHRQIGSPRRMGCGPLRRASCRRLSEARNSRIPSPASCAHQASFPGRPVWGVLPVPRNNRLSLNRAEPGFLVTAQGSWHDDPPPAGRRLGSIPRNEGHGPPDAMPRNSPLRLRCDSTPRCLATE